MNVEVEIISKEIIKPSSPTPNHLRQYQLSFLDNRSPRVYTSLVLFYELKGETQPTISEISKHLKKSLAEVLTLFYPLAGRIKVDNQFIDCNDEGIPFLEARVTNKCRLADVVNNPVAEELSTLIPFQLTDHVGIEFALGVQLNIFECGGFAIGLCTSHKLADGLSMLMFTKTWADIARGSHDHNENYQTKIECPELVSASLFPPKEFYGREMDTDITKDIVTKRFAFSASTIEDLKAKYRGSGSDHHKGPPSRVESLSTFIWRRLMEATKDADQHVAENTLHTMTYIVNLRPKFDPPLPPHSFGNIFHLFMTDFFLSGGEIGDDDDDQETCQGIVRQVREEIEKIDKDYVKRLQHGDEHSSFINRYAQSYTRSKKVVMTACSSLCRFPLYENDFGWGRPTWVGVPPLPVKNLIVLVDTKEVGGIEAYVSLADQHVMTKFENDPLLRRRVGLNRIGSANTSLTRQLARFNQVASFHTRSQPGVVMKKPARIKPTKLGSPSVLFCLLVKLVKK